MKIRVVGIQKQSYKLDSGYEFHGKKLHCIDLDSQRNDLEGNLILNVKIPDSSPLAVMPIEVGGEYTCYFDQKGGLDYLATV